MIEKLSIESKHSDTQNFECTKVVLLLKKKELQKKCGIYLKTDHPTDMCPLFNDNSIKIRLDSISNEIFSSRQSGKSSVALEYIVKSLPTYTHPFQNETRPIIKKLEQQVSQLATYMG
uniref:Uncharacterized protein n=1 Tax=Lactuca sativa TaxID=4236 RepID=A0A9R1XNA4_LACSA|nr:hypothetical protein LSAT_V11C300130020 [Lactuca sativa]